VEHLDRKVMEVRKRNGWAQEHLAQETGVSLSTVAALGETGSQSNLACQLSVEVTSNQCPPSSGL